MHVGPSISSSSNHTKNSTAFENCICTILQYKYLTNKQNNSPKDSRSTESTSKEDKVANLPESMRQGSRCEG